jgi:hypothetical protein
VQGRSYDRPCYQVRSAQPLVKMEVLTAAEKAWLDEADEGE